MAPEELTHKNLIIPEQEHVTEEAAKGRTTKKTPIWVGWPVSYHFGKLKQENHCEYQANQSHTVRIRVCLQRNNRGRKFTRMDAADLQIPARLRKCGNVMVLRSHGDTVIQHMGQWKEDGRLRLA